MATLFYIVTGTPRALLFFFFNDTATTEIYTLSLHDALPILIPLPWIGPVLAPILVSVALIVCGLISLSSGGIAARLPHWLAMRSEEHTSELQSPDHPVCRLLLEKKNPSQTQFSSITCTSPI